MSKDTLTRIREAEAQAQALVLQVEEQAKVMKANAIAEGEHFCRETERSVSEELAGMLEQIREKTAELTARVLEETKAEMEEIAARARLNRKSAEKLVIGGLDTKCR